MKDMKRTTPGPTKFHRIRKIPGEDFAIEFTYNSAGGGASPFIMYDSQLNEILEITKGIGCSHPMGCMRLRLHDKKGQRYDYISPMGGDASNFYRFYYKEGSLYLVVANALTSAGGKIWVIPDVGSDEDIADWIDNGYIEWSYNELPGGGGPYKSGYSNGMELTVIDDPWD